MPVDTLKLFIYSVLVLLVGVMFRFAKYEGWVGFRRFGVYFIIVGSLLLAVSIYQFLK